MISVIFLTVCVCVQEMEQMHRYNQRLIEEMKNKQTQERTRLPKIQRSDAKTRMAMFKKSLRISSTAVTPDLEREKVKQVRTEINDWPVLKLLEFNCCFTEMYSTVYSQYSKFCVVCLWLMSSLPHKRRNVKRTRGFINTRNMRIR